MNTLDNIDGTIIQTEQGPMTIHLLPKEAIDLNVEIACNHPKLAAVLNQAMREDNYGPEIYFGCIAAYCGIVLDSTNSESGYSVQELYQQLGNALVNKREEMAVSVNTMPSVQALVGTMQNMKEAHEEEKAKLILPTDTAIN